MYSTRKLTGVLWSTAVVALLIGGGAAGGCNSAPMQKVCDRWDQTRTAFNAKVRPSQNEIEPVMPDPVADQATQLRGWETSAFIYPNGATLAYPMYALANEDRPKWLKNDYVYSIASPAILLYNVFTMPVYMVMEPPTTAVTYHGVRFPPSMTLAPPLKLEGVAPAKAPTEPQPAPAPQPEANPQPAPAPGAQEPVPPQPTPPAAPEQPGSNQPAPAQPDTSK